MKNFQIVISLFVLMLCCCGSPAGAAEISDIKSISQTIKLYEGILSFPLPMWITGVKSLGNSKFFRNQKKNFFTLEQIPKDQNFESWTNLYGVYGFYLPEYDMKRFIDESLNALALGCKVQGKSKVVSADNSGVILTYFCKDLQEPLVVNGYDTESGFLYMSQVNHSFAKVYMAWRAKKEDMKTDRWPMNKKTVSEAVERLKQIRYFKAE